MTSGDEQKACLPYGYEEKTSPHCDPLGDANLQILQGFQASPAHPARSVCALSTYARGASPRLPGLTHISSAIYAETAAQGIALIFHAHGSNWLPVIAVCRLMVPSQSSLLSLASLEPGYTARAARSRAPLLRFTGDQRCAKRS